MITEKLEQYESCPVNKHPCFPGSGDKMRVEPDFEISGWQFARVYHSLAQLDAGALSGGWTTTFSERVITGTTLAYVTELGFYEPLVSMGGSRYRGSVHPDRILEVLGSPASGYRAIRGSEIKEFDAAGRLIKLRDANNGARYVEIFYTGSLLTSLRTAQGRTITFSYEAGRLSTVTLLDGSVIEYGFDANGNLATVLQAGVTRTYIYGEADRSTSSKLHLLTGKRMEHDGQEARYFAWTRTRKTCSNNSPLERNRSRPTGVWAVTLAILCAAFGGQAAAAETMACYGTVCYDALSKAVAAMRADSPYGPLARNPKGSVVESNATRTVVRITYEIDSRVPESYLGPGYLMGGHGVQSTGCTPAESAAHMCADEGTLIALYSTLYKNGLATCSLRNERIEGSYVEPFRSSSAAFRSRRGSLDFRTQRDKWWKLEAKCPAREAGEYGLYQLLLIKSQDYVCPAGFNDRILARYCGGNGSGHFESRETDLGSRRRSSRWSRTQLQALAIQQRGPQCGS